MKKKNSGRIAIGADHRGYQLKKKIIAYLVDRGYDVIDVGTHKEGVSCDYPLLSKKVARAVATQKNTRGILVCMTGIGHAIAANKIAGVRASLCYNRQAAHFARAHNDANVLVFGARFVPKKELFTIIRVWLMTPFQGGRHARRVNQIKRIEKEFCKTVR